MHTFVRKISYNLAGETGFDKHGSGTWTIDRMKLHHDRSVKSPKKRERKELHVYNDSGVSGANIL